jgi:signal transduction histidine kinase
VAQEAVRNALRHAEASSLTVAVGADGDLLHLDVTDDGRGIGDRPDTGGIGLRGLRDLVREAGGRLQVRSSAGAGTTVHLEVPR